jgi:uncharacterized protein (TIGR04255 family)
MTSVSFERPPLVETVLGVQFDSISGLSNAHLGAFWKTLGPEWPYVSDAPPLEFEFEQFGESHIWSALGVQFRVTQDPATRIQIRNARKDRMLQIQNGRLHYNWLGHLGHSYPRFSVVQPEFDDLLSRLTNFLQAEKLEAPKFNQWEVTYVNQLGKGTVWSSPEEWANVFLPLGCTRQSLPGIGKFESFGGEWHFEIEPQRGRLHIKVQHGRTMPPEENEALIIKLTARGPINLEQPALSVGLDLGHKSIVSSFISLTSENAQAYWRHNR